jgi:predicted DNA-binding transcriptional regulator YafY
MRVDFESEDQALFVALGLGARVRVMEPAALRDRIAAEVVAMSDGTHRLGRPSSRTRRKQPVK